MTPFNIHSAVSAHSTQVWSPDEESILVEAGLQEPLRWFLAQTKPPPPHQVGLRPAKRRKLSHDVHEPAQEPEPEPEPEVDSTDLIVFAQASLDIGIGNSVPGDGFTGLAQDSTSLTHIPLRLVDVLQDNLDLTLVLGREWHDSALIEIHTDKVDKLHFECLQACARVMWDLPPRIRRLNTRDSSVLTCILSMSQEGDYSTLCLRIGIKWRDGGSAESDQDARVLTTFFPEVAPSAVRATSWSPRDFYESVYTPSRDAEVVWQNSIDAHLYPFQNRTVQWMLDREQALVSPEDNRSAEARAMISVRLYEEAEDAFGNQIFGSPVSMTVSTIRPPEVSTCSGGILAEEMGLGKTVEIAALIAAHPRTDLDIPLHDLTPSTATLIITPMSILQQWRTELAQHAPSLRVYHYTGTVTTRSEGKHNVPDAEFINEMASNYDVVLTTYQTLTREVHFAIEPPARNMRRPRKYERPRCPIVKIQWWRICLDEAQMVETGVSAAARVACQLPRVHSWAVSGTPVKRDVEDLHGLLIFLRLEPFASNERLWRSLLQASSGAARRLFHAIALRHTKAQVRDDIQLPPQKRVVLTLPFTTVESQHYLNLFEEMCEAVGVNMDGSPASAEWDPEDSSTIATMKSWLARLRRTCLNPQIAARGHRRLGRRVGALRTVDEVLDAMIDQNELLSRIEERAAIQAQLTTGHVMGNCGADQHRSLKALHVYESTVERTRAVVEQSKHRLKAAQANSLLRNPKSSSDDDDESSPDEAESLLGRFRANVRSAQELLHTCIYFAASAKYQIKANDTITTPDSDQYKRLDEAENALYDQAKAVRREILSDAHHKAERAMIKIKAMRDYNQLMTIPTIKDVGRLGGIGTRGIIEKSYDLFDTIRNIGTAMIDWRSKMVEILTMSLVDEELDDKELKGDEYEQSTKHQDELYVYFDAYKALQADLNRCISGETAPLIDNEARGLLRAAKRWLDPDVMMDLKGQVHAPELTVELFSARQEIRVKLDKLESVRGLIAEARRLSDPAFTKSATECTIAAQIATHLQQISTSYSKALQSFEKEVDLFRAAQNLRLEFYRQLQAISDAVAPYKEKLDDELDSAALDEALNKEVQHSAALAQLRTKHRFLTHLKDESGKDESARICVICQTTFENGVLTVCGHQYCKECIQQWWRAHRSCPVCKRRLSLVDFHNITYKPREVKVQEEEQQEQSSPASSTTTSATNSRQASIYSEVDSQLMQQIKSYDLTRSYGTKIDTLGRHLLWIREHDPGAKSIVFSQYREFLDVLSTAFAEFKIGHARLGAPGAVESFRKEASKDCLLLDAKTDSSGLTLVNATHVFICEPLVQTAVELQAIARVHRIGQTRTTTVWMYLVNDTVEESIYAISKTRRLAHMQSKLAVNSAQASGASTPFPVGEQAIDKANSDELQSAQLSNLLESGKHGGEVVGKDLLWECLFGNAQKAGNTMESQTQADIDRNLRAHAAERRAQLLSR